MRPSVLYAVARDGVASDDEDVPGKDLQPLVAAIEEAIPPPKDRTEEPFCMQVNQLSYDDFVGRLVIGRIVAGSVKTNDNVLVQSESGLLKGSDRNLPTIALNNAGFDAGV